MLLECLQAANTLNDGRNQQQPNSIGSPLQPNIHEQTREETDNTNNNRDIYFWGGRFHLFPQDIELPKGSVAQAWQLWCCGDSERMCPPFKSLHPSELKSSNAKKRLSEYKFLMNLIENRAISLGIFKAKPTIPEAIEIFAACKDVTNVPETSLKNRKRRVSQLSWITVATLIRKKKVATPN